MSDESTAISANDLFVVVTPASAYNDSPDSMDDEVYASREDAQRAVDEIERYCAERNLRSPGRTVQTLAEYVSHLRSQVYDVR